MPESHHAGFAYAWEFQVAPGQSGPFENAYGPHGDWARLFSRDPEYLGTWLLRDPRQPDRYVTIDRWRSQEARDRFVRRFRADYDELDRRCDALTLAERWIGDFDLLAADRHGPDSD